MKLNLNPTKIYNLSKTNKELKILKNVLKEITKPEYDFLRKEPDLGKNMILLVVSGSIAYGTDTDDSDIDIRGVTSGSKDSIFGLNPFKNYTDKGTDTSIYSIRHIMELLVKSNPTALELLGTRDSDILAISKEGMLLRDSKSLFLSQNIKRTYGGFAMSVLKQIENSTQDKLKDLTKQATHPPRLLMTAIDILEKGELNVYREKERDLLQSIRKGDFLDFNKKLNHSYFEMIYEYEKKFKYAIENTHLPILPDLEKINELAIEINKSIYKNKLT